MRPISAEISTSSNFSDSTTCVSYATVSGANISKVIKPLLGKRAPTLTALYLKIVTTARLCILPRPRGHKTFFMLNSTEHEIFLLINVKILTLMSGK